jgi:hypothetical protein
MMEVQCASAAFKQALLAEMNQAPHSRAFNVTAKLDWFRYHYAA